mmetsp:Transcript_71487/g.184334  ORF Transcript_71487/g.184334 Transcript_71487/m.184334 type:complete len:234 (-) Transcript_71487:329-1030(-)
MAEGSIVLHAYPSLEEHEAHKAFCKSKLAELREKNARHNETFQQIVRKCEAFSKEAKGHRAAMVDMQDRSKFVQLIIDTVKPESKTFAPAHEFYQEQSGRVRERSLQLLNEEMTQSGGPSSQPVPRAQRKPAPRVRKCPANFSPFQGLTENEVMRKSDPVLLGLRSSLHWSGNRRPGTLPSLLPRDSPVHPFSEHTSAWKSRQGADTFGHSRARISELSRSQEFSRSSSSPFF